MNHNIHYNNKVNPYTNMNKRKYRIIEEKYNNYSLFYPQYKDADCGAYFIKDNNGNNIKSEYQYFTKWIEKKLTITSFSYKEKVSYDNLKDANDRIQLDINQRKEHIIKETIIHEYKHNE